MAPSKAEIKLRNLRPWKKGDPNIPKSPGRPRYKDLVEDLRETYADMSPRGRANLARLRKQMEKRHPDSIYHYLAGKPIERIELSGELKHTVDPNLVAAAQVIAKNLREGSK